MLPWTLALEQQRPELCFVGLDFAQAMLKAGARNRCKAGWSPERLCLGRGGALHLPLQAGRLDAVTGALDRNFDSTHKLSNFRCIMGINALTIGFVDCTESGSGEDSVEG